MRQINLYIHVISAITWIGGIIFLTLVGPALRSKDPTEGREFLRTMAIKFRDYSWIAVILLITTGVVNLYYWQWTFGPIMHAKLGLVLLMIIVKFLHDFVIGPKAAADYTPGSTSWKGAMLLGRTNLVLGLSVLYLALSL
jgi:putative copper export protein